jgi:sortase (surface protein transpeptidase)
MKSGFKSLENQPQKNQMNSQKTKKQKKKRIWSDQFFLKTEVSTKKTQKRKKLEVPSFELELQMWWVEPLMIYHLHKQTKEGSNVIYQSIEPTSKKK